MNYKHMRALLSLSDGKGHTNPLLHDFSWLYKELFEMGLATQTHLCTIGEGTWHARELYSYRITDTGRDLLPDHSR